MTSYGLTRLRNLQLFRPANGMWSNLGMRLIEAESGSAVVEADFQRALHGRGSEIHRGAVAAIADAALACAAATLVQEGEVATTVELVVDFFRPASPGRAVARGRASHRAGHLVYCEAVVEQSGSTVAEGHATIALVRPP